MGYLDHDEPDIGFNAFDRYVSFISFAKRHDDRKLIGKELLVFWTVEFIMNPLLQRDISADKEDGK